MKNRKRNYRNILTTAAISILIAAVAMLFVSSFADTRSRVEDLTQEYIKNGTIQTAQTINSIFTSGMMSLESIGRLYGENETKVQHITAADIRHMTQDVWFDRLIFVDQMGTGIDGEGNQYDFINSPNYVAAMQGNAGVSSTYVYNEDSVNQLCFYAPVCDDSDIFGALLGYFSDDTLKEMLQTEYYGYDSDVFLCNKQGNIIASTVDIGERLTINLFFNGKDAADELTKDRLLQHMKVDIPYGFRYQSEEGETQAYMSGIDACDLNLIQTYPVAAVERMQNIANADNIKLAIALIALFVLYIIVLAVLARSRWRRVETENQSVKNMIGAITKMFDRFMLVDLEHDTYEYTTNSDAVLLPGVEQKGAYHDVVDKVLRYCYRSDENKEPMDQYCTAENLRQLFSDGRDTLMFEYSEEFPGTDYRWTNLAIMCVERKDGIASKVLLASQDETAIKIDEIRSKDALRDAYHAAENASMAKSDFLSKMSHDIRTPMNAIIGMTALAASHTDDKERVEECLKKITVSSRHLLALINEVLDMSRIESDRLTLAEEEFDLSDLIETTLELIQPSTKEKQQKLSIVIKKIEHEYVIGDSLYVQKIFTNIMSNAVKYTPNGGSISVMITEKPSSFAKTGCFEFVFEDTGIGMSPEFLDRIYEPFERAKDSRIDKIQGTGLGMAIVKNVVQMMGGDIAIESVVDQGTRVTVTIMLKLQDKEFEDDSALADLSVLVADDEEIACVTVCNMLESLGMHSEWVLSGKEALEKTVMAHEQRQDYNAVILDWLMPDMNGIETARQIRSRIGDEIPLIIISAYDWSEIENEARQAGVDAFISKPIFKSKLSATFKNLFIEEEMEDLNEIEAFRQKRFEHKRALLVDDNDINREIAKELLEMTGILVETAEDGKQAVERVISSPDYYYDIIFLDIQMPVMNGYEASLMIRSQDRKDLRNVPIIAVTANAFPEDIMDAKHAGMNQHLSKPIDIMQLQNVLNRWLQD